MGTIIAKIDEETLRALDEMSGGGPRSEVIRKALRQYVARHKLEERRRQVEEYVSSGGEAQEMSRLAESDIDEAAELLRKAEKP
jgi:metal-responsive CopG/Arc/MetJ family transcriptional regulator